MLWNKGNFVRLNPRTRNRPDVQRRSTPEAESEESFVDDLVHDEAASEVGIRRDFLVQFLDRVVALHSGSDVVDTLVTETCRRAESILCPEQRIEQTNLRQRSRSL